MKKIVSGKVLQDSMKEAINLLCDTVKSTLGPKGFNVIVDQSSFSPFITNDGVTIAESICSSDEVVNVILELAKEASIVTNNTVGDGTTTTLVILQSLFNQCLDLVNEGENPIVIKKELNNSLNVILELLLKEKKPINDKVIYNIAEIASGDEKIAKIVSDVFFKIPYKEGVDIKEVNERSLRVKYYNGYSFQSVLASPLFLRDQVYLNYNDSLVLIINGILSDLENISVILNEVFTTKRCLVIFATDFSELVVNEIISYVLNKELKCLLVKISDYGLRLRVIEKDLEVISGGKIVNNETEVSVQHLGHFSNIYVTGDNFRVDFIDNEDIEEYVLGIETEIKELQDDFMKEFYFKRLSMFNNGTAQIEIGEFTKTELREKRMRLDDALCAVYSSKDGVLIGGGVTLLKVSNSLNGDSKVSKIWKETLISPLRQLLYNSGLDYKVISEKVLNEDFNLVYNVSKDCFEQVSKTNVFDSYNVVANSLINACSIVSMLITTNSLVINEQINNLNKINEYGDI